MNRLRWCLLATHVPPGGALGGVVRYTVELARALAARDDVALTVVTTGPAAPTLAELTSDRARVHTVGALPTPALALAERLLPLAPADVDVVHGVKHLVPRRSTALRALTVHDLLLLDRPDDFGGAKRRLLPGPYRASLREADLLLSVSTATRERLVAHDPSTLLRTAVVPLATSERLRRAVAQPVPELLGRRYALVVGDASPRKNLAMLFEAWAAVRRHVPDAVLAVAGPPDWSGTAARTVHARLAANGALVALGHVGDARLRWAYEHAAVVLCPSLAEGFGLPAAEALELGAPVVVSDDPALREVAAGRALAEVPARDGAGWTAACAAALTDPPVHRPRPGRDWEQVAEESVGAVRAALVHRGSAA